MRTGTNLLKVKDYNQRLVLEIIRLGDGASRVEIAERTGLTAQTVSNIVRRLLSEGVIEEVGKGRSRGGGKPRVLLRLRPGAGYAVGVQIDRDEVRVALVDLAGRVVGRRRHPLAVEGPEDVVKLAVGAVGEVIREGGVKSGKVLGVGVAAPGPLDPRGGVVYGPPGMEGWEEVALREKIEAACGYPVVLDNDAVASAVGERWIGAARGVRDFLFVYAGWGISAGIFVDGQLYRGRSGTAGEIGHIPLDPEGPVCGCGNRGCLVRYCSPREITARVRRRLDAGEESTLREIHGRNPAALDYEAVRRAAAAGDRLALEEVGESARMLGRALVGLANTLDPEKVVLGGRAFGGVGEVYRREAEEALGRVLYPGRRQVGVEVSASGEEAVALGAAALVLHDSYAPRMQGLEAL